MADLDHIKAMIRSVLMTASYGVLASKFPKEYEETTGSVLPLKGLGVRSINDLPKLMPDVIKSERNAQGQVVFYVVANEKIRHIAMMKSKEKGKSKKNRRPAGAKKMFFASSSGGPVGRTPAALGTSSSRSAAKPVQRPSPPVTRSAPKPVAKPVSSRPVTQPKYTAPVAPRFQQSNNTSRAANPVSRPSQPAQIRRAVPAELLCSKIKTLMSEFSQGLWSGKLVSEFETYFKEPAEPNLLELVLQMEGRVVRIERPYGQNTNKMILYGIEDDPVTTPVPVAAPANGKSGGRTNIKYPHTYRYVHAPLPWLGVRADCYVTLAHNPSYFWVQVKSPQLDDLVKITPLIQNTCESAPPEQHGRFYVNELVCGLFEEDQQWYRAIVLDVGNVHDSCLDSLDPALFLPNNPTPQFKWRDSWKVKLFFVDYGNIEWVTLDRVRRKKFPYPNGQAFRCSLGSITPKDEWSKQINETFREITENRDCESLQMTVEAVKSDKAHYGFKSRLNEWCQKRKHEFATFTKPLNSDCGWRTSCTIKHPTKGYKTYQGFYQNKKNDAEASAAQLVIRDWDITLLDSKDIPAHWIEVILENKDTKEVYNKSLVESGAAVAKTSIYDMCIPKQPDPSEIPQLKSELETHVTYTVDDSSDDESMSDEDEDQTRSPQQVDPEEVELPEVGSLVYMYVTHVQSPKNICMRNIDGDNDRTLIMMEDDLTDFVRDNGTVLTSVQVNQLCAVQSEKVYYRARVLRLLKNNRAEVLMLDYGDTQLYRLNELFYLDSRFLVLPYQALSCSLFGLEKIIHAESLTDFIRTKIEEEKFHVKIKDIVNERTLSVELRTDEGANMNELFLSQDIRNLNPRLPDDGEPHLVRLTNVSSEGVISLQIDGPGLTSLGELMKELRDHYEANSARASDYIVDPQQGQICCSSRLEDGERRWYRTVINRNVSEHTVEVTYVDYGTTQIIPMSKLREPAKAVPNISRLPFQAYPVMLADLPTSPSMWTEKEVQKLYGYLADQTQIEAERAGGSEGGDEAYPLVRIYLSSGPDDAPKELNKLLSTDRNLFQTHSIGTSKLGLQLGSLSLANPTFIDPKDIVLDQNKIPKLSLQRQAEAMISHVDNPYSWYFQSREFHEQFRVMGEEMNKFYSQPLDCPEVLWKVNNLCVAYCDQYQGWYRARITRVVPPDGKLMECSMVDYGDTQRIPLSSIRPLIKQFASLPIQACKAALCGVMPADGSMQWSEEAKRFFTAAVSEQMVWVRLVAQDSTSQILWMHIIDTSHAENDVYISNALVEEGLGIRPPPNS